MPCTSSTSILRFLLTPETTSPGSADRPAPCDNRGWQAVKAVVWIAVGIFSAVVIGQL